LNRYRKKNISLSDVEFRIPDLPKESEMDDYTPMKLIKDADFSQEELLSEIDNLKPNHKSVFNLYVIDGYKHHEIAELLAISEGTSKSHLARARKKIQKSLYLKAEKRNSLKHDSYKLSIFLAVGSNANETDLIFRSSFSDFRISPVHQLNYLPIHKSLINWALIAKILPIIGVGSYLAITFTSESNLFKNKPYLKDSIQNVINSESIETPNDILNEFQNKELNQSDTDLVKEKSQHNLNDFGGPILLKENKPYREYKAFDSDSLNSGLIDSLGVKDSILPVIIYKTIIIRDTIYKQK
jgi:predicted DNA-binding protein (UPF0251 family)